MDEISSTIVFSIWVNVLVRRQLFEYFFFQVLLWRRRPSVAYIKLRKRRGGIFWKTIIFLEKDCCIIYNITLFSIIQTLIKKSSDYFFNGLKNKHVLLSWSISTNLIHPAHHIWLLLKFLEFWLYLRKKNVSCSSFSHRDHFPSSNLLKLSWEKKRHSGLKRFHSYSHRLETEIST